MLDLTKKSNVEYVTLSKLGSGAFGTTFLATKKDDITNKKYVLKVLKITPKNLTDIFQEVDVLRKISSKGCPSTLLCFHDYFVTELDKSMKVVIVTEAFENAITLGNFIYARKMVPIEPRDILKIMHSLLEGLYYLHQHKIAHGDIKPENILINNNLHTQLIDFGLSCRKNCKAGGTMLFSAPEMIRLLGSRREIQRSFLSDTDVFSMGLVFYLLANYKFPYSLKTNPYIGIDTSTISETDVGTDDSVISSRRSFVATPEHFDVKFPNDIIGIDTFWRKNGGNFRSEYKESDDATNADINALIETMLITSTHQKASRPSSKRLLTKLRRIIFKYNLQNNLATRRLIVLSPNSELESLTPLSPSPTVG